MKARTRIGGWVAAALVVVTGLVVWALVTGDEPEPEAAPPTTASAPTTAPPTTVAATTTLPAPQMPIIWTAEHENGGLSEWAGVTTSSSADVEVVDAPGNGHEGQALALTVKKANGKSSPGPGVRMRVETTAISPDDETAPDNLPADAYYSAWYYFPEKLSPYTNVFQWKQAAVDGPDSQTRRLLYFIRADWDEDAGAFTFHLRGKAGEDGEMDDQTYSVATTDLTFPTETWVQLECRYIWSHTPDGEITCWQDGEELWSVSDLITEYDYDYLSLPRQWTVNHYVNEIRPRNHTIFVDDAAVSLERLGPDA